MNHSEKQPSGKQPSLQDFLKIPWLGLRPDVILHAGPIDANGERSWILEDPVRGTHYRLGYAEGELVFRLATEPTIDAAVSRLYAQTTLRPSVEEILSFVGMLQRESLAMLPPDAAIQKDTDTKGKKKTAERRWSYENLWEILTFFRIPLLRPDRFLIRTLPWVSWLWAPFSRLMWLVLGLAGVMRTLQEIELYLGTVSYLFTPQGAVVFFLCLAFLKTGHEFAHAYTAKSLGLHVRSMGVIVIVLWPMFYTDTTDVWKVPDRRRRQLVSLAGILFELTLSGLAFLAWSLLPDGILKSLMFFLSGTSLISSVLVNLNPFNRYDGYYLLMDMWGVDNLRPRATAMLRHTVRKWLLDWQGPAPEIHPASQRLILYGLGVVIYRLFISFSIALAVYFLYHPIVGATLFVLELSVFIIYPIWIEIAWILRDRQYIGSRFRVAMTLSGAALLIGLLIVPFTRLERLPCLVLYKGAVKIEAPHTGQLVMKLPDLNKPVAAGELLTRISDDELAYEVQKADFDLAVVQAKIQHLGSGGEQGAYRNWLMAEEQRIQAALEKFRQASAQLEIRAPITGRIADVNDDLYEGAFLKKGTYLVTIAASDELEAKAYIHERLIRKIESFEDILAAVHFPEPETPEFTAALREKSRFPARIIPNESLFDYAGGPMMTVRDAYGVRPKDAYFAYTFDILDEPVVADGGRIPHGKPSWIWVKSERQSLIGRMIRAVWRSITQRGFL